MTEGIQSLNFDASWPYPPFVELNSPSLKQFIHSAEDLHASRGSANFQIQSSSVAFFNIAPPFNSNGEDGMFISNGKFL